MSSIRSRIERLERSEPGEAEPTTILWHNLCARRPEDIVPDGNDWSWLLRPYVPQPCPIDLVLKQAERGNFITLEQAKAMIARGEIPPSC